MRDQLRLNINNVEVASQDQSSLLHKTVKMKVLSWSKKLSFSEKPKLRKTRSSQLKSNKKSGLKKSVSSISRFLSSSTPLKSLKNRSKSSVASDDVPVLLPLTIKLENNISSSFIRPRSQTLCDRSELRSILHQRFRQRIMERSMAAVILEARQQLEKEISNQSSEENEDVYVPFDFNHQRRKVRGNIPESDEEDVYMTMS